MLVTTPTRDYIPSRKSPPLDRSLETQAILAEIDAQSAIPSGSTLPTTTVSEDLPPEDLDYIEIFPDLFFEETPLIQPLPPTPRCTKPSTRSTTPTGRPKVEQPSTNVRSTFDPWQRDLKIRGQPRINSLIPASDTPEKTHYTHTDPYKPPYSRDACRGTPKTPHDTTTNGYQRSSVKKDCPTCKKYAIIYKIKNLLINSVLSIQKVPIHLHPSILKTSN